MSRSKLKSSENIPRGPVKKRSSNGSAKSSDDKVSPNKRPKRSCNLSMADIKVLQVEVLVDLVNLRDLRLDDGDEHDSDNISVAQQALELATFSDSAESILSRDNVSTLPKGMKKLAYQKWHLSINMFMLFVEIAPNKWYCFKRHNTEGALCFYCQICMRKNRKTYARIVRDDENKDCIFGIDDHVHRCAKTFGDIQMLLESHPVKNMTTMRKQFWVDFDVPFRVPDDKWILPGKKVTPGETILPDPSFSLNTSDLPEETTVVKDYMYIISNADQMTACKFVLKGQSSQDDLVYMCATCLARDVVVYCQISCKKKRILVETDDQAVHRDCFTLNLKECMAAEDVVFVNTIIPIKHEKSVGK